MTIVTNMLEKLFFAHSRLHLSGGENDGLQPVITECKKFIFVYNGEVYNHKSLSNFKLSNKSDTDSISYSLSMNGVENTIRKLNGMFALAIYELEKSILYLAVDRFGQKPLFYSLQNDLVRFGSIASTVTSYNSIQNLESNNCLDTLIVALSVQTVRYIRMYRVPANSVVTVNTENNEVSSIT